MLSLGSLAFATPGMLALLLVLPAIYWLLRLIPPLPRLVRFPAIRLLIGLEPTEQTPMKMPWWLLLLRMVLAAALIFAVARPVSQTVMPLLLSKTFTSSLKRGFLLA